MTLTIERDIYDIYVCTKYIFFILSYASHVPFYSISTLWSFILQRLLGARWFFGYTAAAWLPDCLTARLIKTLGRGTWVIKMKSNSHSPPSVRPSVRPSSSCSTRSLCTRFIIKLELYYFNKTPRDPFCPVLTGLLAPLPSPHVSFSISHFALSHSQLQSFCAFGHAPFALRLINMIIMGPCREHFIIRLSSNAAQQWNKELSLCSYWFFRVTNSAMLQT